MSLQKKLDLWAQKKLITQKQSDKILSFEKENNNGFFAKTALIISALFIGLGICLIVAANWEKLPTVVKFIADFAIFGAFVYGAWQSIQKNKVHPADVFLFLSFLMTAATIGLVAQTFHLNGSWTSFALSWAVLSLPYVLFSQSFSFNIFWWLVFFSGLFNGILEPVIDYVFSHFDGMVWLCLMSGALSHGLDMIDKVIKGRVLLLKSLSKLCLLEAYIALIGIALGYGLPHHYNHDFTAFAVIFVAAVLVFRGFLAYQTQNISSLKNNTFLAEAYIFAFFASLFDDLLMSGFGFILSGLFILLMIYVFKKTAKYLQEQRRKK